MGPVRELESDAQDISPQEMTLDHSDEALLQSDTANQNTELEQGSTCTIKISEEKVTPHRVNFYLKHAILIVTGNSMIASQIINMQMCMLAIDMSKYNFYNSIV